MEPTAKCLERSSVQALVEISAGQELLDVSVQLSARSFDHNPTPRRASKKPCILHSSRYPTNSRIQLSHTRSRNVALPRKRYDLTLHISPPHTNTAYMDSFRSYLNYGSPALRCKCMFLGGGGFKIAGSEGPCNSPICVNRIRNRFLGKMEDERCRKPTHVPSEMFGTKTLHYPATANWLSLKQSPRKRSPEKLRLVHPFSESSIRIASGYSEKRLIRPILLKASVVKYSSSVKKLDRNAGS